MLLSCSPDTGELPRGFNQTARKVVASSQLILRTSLCYFAFFFARITHTELFRMKDCAPMKTSSSSNSYSLLYRHRCLSYVISQSRNRRNFSGAFPFQVLNLRYDLTPIGNISVIATETGLIRTYAACLHVRRMPCIILFCYSPRLVLKAQMSHSFITIPSHPIQPRPLYQCS